MTRIFWAGECTVTQNTICTYPQTGIGQVFHLFLKKEVTVENYADDYVSSKSFIDGYGLAKIYDRIGKRDFLFIQFGHNDEKKEDVSRYSSPYEGYMDNLEKFVHVARNKKAFPVLITPLERRYFQEGGTLYLGDHSDYVAAMKQTAEKHQVPLIDLYSMSRAELKKAGDENSRRWYMDRDGIKSNYDPLCGADRTHLKYEGAVVFGNCIARGLNKLGGVYQDILMEGYDENTC